MLALPAALLIGAGGVPEAGDVAALERLWSGVRDSSEQVVMTLERGAALWPQASERRVRTIIAPVDLAWLGPHVLYLEEFIEDDPQRTRRQLLLQLEPAAEPPHAVRVRLFTFTEAERWTHLNYRPALLASLTRADIAASAGCDLLLARSGEQFRGGTVGRRCLDSGSGTGYLDYQLVIGEELYWYRRRLLRQSDGELQQEVIGFNRFEPNEARLYECRIAWSSSDNARNLRPFVTLEMYEAGGRGHFVTPDRRAFELTLHGRDWPFAVDRDSLLLSLQEQGSEHPLATAWAQMDAQQVSLDLGWLEVRCGALAPDSDELAQ
jgi:hypothetical protein